jgi:hypothetical protein
MPTITAAPTGRLPFSSGATVNWRSRFVHDRDLRVMVPPPRV